MNFHGYKNPHDVKMYVEAKAEDMRNPKNPLNRSDRTIWALAFLVIGILLFIFLYPVEKEGETYTSLDDALLYSNFEEVQVASTQRNTLKKLLIRNHHYQLVSEDFYLDSLDHDIIEMFSNMTVKKENCIITIEDSYYPFSQTMTISYTQLPKDDLSSIFKENNAFSAVFHPFENLDLTLDDTIYEDYLKDHTNKMPRTINIDSTHTLTCQVDIFEDQLMITYKLTKK